MELTPSARAPLPGPLCPLPLECCAAPSSFVAALPRAVPQPSYDLGIVTVPSDVWPYAPTSEAADDDVVLMIDGIATRRRRLYRHRHLAGITRFTLPLPRNQRCRTMEIPSYDGDVLPPYQLNISNGPRRPASDSQGELSHYVNLLGESYRS